MIIAGLQKLTLTDFPGNVACIIFLKGCNLRCPYCQNSELIENRIDDNYILKEEVFSFLKKRQGTLDGVVITGGEPTLTKELPKFIREIRDLGFKIKLDTNGTNPKMLKELLEDKLLDYVAMDIKNIDNKFAQTTGLSKEGTDKLLKNTEESIKILKKSKVDHEFRTTIMKNYHTVEDLDKINEMIGNDEKYFLQNFEDSEFVLDHKIQAFSEDELKEINNKLKEKFPNTSVRGL